MIDRDTTKRLLAELEANWETAAHDQRLYRLIEARSTADEVLSVLIAELEDKVRRRFGSLSGVTYHDLRIEAHPSEEATVTFRGETFYFDVSGITRIVGEARRRGETCQIFTKWVSHPFYQYHHH